MPFERSRAPARPRTTPAPSLLLLLLLAALLAPGRAPAQARLPGEVPLEDLLQIVELDREIVALDARGGSGTTEALRLGEEVLLRVSRGQVGVALTDQRILAVAASSGAWQSERYRQGETVAERPLLGDRVALVLTTIRVIGFDGGSGNLIELRLGPGERLIGRAVSGNVAVAVTDRRAVGLSPFVGGFFEADLRVNEKFEGVEADANLATVRTSRRLLTFRAPSGSWGERRLGLGN
jgi:hypothetical protein